MTLAIDTCYRYSVFGKQFNKSYEYRKRIDVSSFKPSDLFPYISMMNRIAIFCGSKAGRNSAYTEATKDLVSIIAQQKIEIVYGGGAVGLMGIVAETALANGGTITGVIPEKLYEMEVAHTGLTKLYRVKDMHERKALMADLSDAFIALPGGVGTLEEITEVMTWSQLGYHAKPCAFLNTLGYYDHFLQFFDHMENQGFLYKSIHEQCIISNSPRDLIDKLLMC